MTRALTLLVSALLCLGQTSAAPEPELLRVYFLDVGQGDAVLIRTPSGQSVLYDGGDSPTQIITHLSSLAVSQIDLVVASHNHADHIGGLAEVIGRFRPRFYLDNGVPSSTLTYSRVIEAVRLAGSALLEPTARRIQLRDGMSLDVMPPPGIAGWDQNDNSIGLMITFGQFRLSLAGDAEQREWAWWTQNYSTMLSRVQVHKASHHGSDKGDTAAAMALLAPEAVVISVGQYNSYGHPHPEALRLYAEGNSATVRTDLSGTIVVEAEASGRYVIKTTRPEAVKALPSLNLPMVPLPRSFVWRTPTERHNRVADGRLQ